MKIRELTAFSKKLLKNKKASTMMICLLPLAAELFFRFAEAAVFSLLLYFGEMPPIALFSGESKIQLAVTLIAFVLRTAVTAPLLYGAVYRLMEMCDENRKRSTPFSRILMSRKNFRKSLAIMLWSKIIGFLALIPTAFFGINAYSLFIRSHNVSGIFLTCHACMLTIISAAFWISVRLSLAAGFFLAAHFPKMSAFKIIIYSLRFMRGRKKELMKPVLFYIPVMITVIGIPYAVTRLMTAYALGISIYIKEDEYFERNKTDRGISEADNSSDLPYRPKRRFKTSAYKAETSGGGNHA